LSELLLNYCDSKLKQQKKLIKSVQQNPKQKPKHKSIMQKKKVRLNQRKSGKLQETEALTRTDFRQIFEG
jgi:hypothetical protein